MTAHEGNNPAQRFEELRAMLSATAKRMGAPVDDSVQGFFADVVLERRLFERLKSDARADEQAAYVHRAFVNYVIDQHRRDRKDTRHTFNGLLETAGTARSIDHRWACVALTEAIRRTEEYLKSRNLNDHWTAFERRILQPAITSSTPPSITETCRDLDFKTAAQASAALLYVKRTLKAILSDVIKEHGVLPEEADDPVSLIRAYLDR